MSKIIAIVLLILGISVFTAVGQTSVHGRPERKHIVITDCGVPYELVVLSVTGPVGHMFLLADGKYYKERDLTLLFRCVARKYPEYSVLVVTLFSDREYLQVAIREHFYPPPDSNPPDDTSKTDCLNWRTAVRPCPYGYYRAVYYRDEPREILRFSEDPNKTSMRTVNLPKK